MATWQRMGITAVVVAMFALPLVAEDWTNFHGVARDNISRETSLLKSWDVVRPKLLWRIDTVGASAKVSGFGTVAVVAGKVYITGNVDREGADAADAVLYCLDANTGREVWQCPLGDGWKTPRKYEGERSTPTIDAERAYILTGNGLLVCVDLTKSEVVWRYDLVTHHDASHPYWGMAESPVIDGDLVFVSPGGTKASVVAVNKHSGKFVWAAPAVHSSLTPREEASYTTGTVFDFDGQRIFATMTQLHLILIDVRTGHLVGQHLHRNDRDVKANTPRYLGDGRIALASGYGDGGVEMLQLARGDNNSITCTQLWRQIKLDNNHAGVVYWNGYAYGTSHKYKGGAWVCVNLADGSVAWEAKGIGTSAITLADGMLYGVDENEGNVAIIKATLDGYHEAGRFTLPEEGAGKYWAHPVVAGKKLFLRHDNFLYCYDLTDPK